MRMKHHPCNGAEAITACMMAEVDDGFDWWGEVFAVHVEDFYFMSVGAAVDCNVSVGGMLLGI